MIRVPVCPSLASLVSRRGLTRDRALHLTAKVLSLVSLVSRLILKYFLPPSAAAGSASVLPPAHHPLSLLFIVKKWRDTRDTRDSTLVAR